MNTLQRPPFPKNAVLFGLGAFVLLSLLFQFVDWDQQVAAHYYAQGWPGRSWPWADLLYHHGEQWSVVVGSLGALAFSLSFAAPRFRAWRGPGLYLGLLLLLGPGLLVNGLAKALAGRPRPSDCLDLGGLWSFARPFHFGTPGQGVSFLSGHAAAAWYFFGFFWVLRGPRRWIGLLATLIYGALMAWARVSQGAHWVSDTVLCGAAIFTLAAALSPLIHWQPSRRFWSRPRLSWALAFGALAWLSISNVRYEDRRFINPWPHQHVDLAQERDIPGIGDHYEGDIGLTVSLQRSDLDLRFQEQKGLQSLPFSINTEFWGQGLPGARQEMSMEGRRGWALTESLKGVWLQARGRAELVLPKNLAIDLTLHAPQSTLTIGYFPYGRRVLLSHLPEGVHPPAGFQPYANSSWLRDGALPLISLDIQASKVIFE